MATRSEVHTDHSAVLTPSIRPAELADGVAIWQLVSESDTLDTNSCYTYLLLCSDFADTCLVSYDGDRLAGFVAGYIPPPRDDTVFVWQIGVSASYRGEGLGRQLLSRFVDRAIASGVRYLEATVTPSNTASERLFRSLAQSRGWELTVTRRFEAHHFAGLQHEQELLFRIGPLKE